MTAEEWPAADELRWLEVNRRRIDSEPLSLLRQHCDDALVRQIDECQSESAEALPRGAAVSTDDLISAVHEAGHAWAYHRARLPLRYATIRPRGLGEDAGQCQPWRARRVTLAQAISTASAGPIAEAIMSERLDVDGEFEFENHLSGAVFAGGHADAVNARGALDLPEYVDLVRTDLEASWSSSERVAEMLVEHRTLSGRRVFEELTTRSTHRKDRLHRGVSV